MDKNKLEESIILLKNKNYSEILQNRLIWNDANLKRIKCYLPGDLRRFSGCRYIFSTWVMPGLSPKEIETYFPDLEAIFYAAGSIRYFGKSFLERGIRIFTATEINGLAVAEFTIAQVLLANKGYFMASKGYRWSWKNSKRDEMRIYSKDHTGNFQSTVGIIGIGHIGRKVAEFANNFSLNLIGYDPYVNDSVFKQLQIKRVNLEELFSLSDVVTCHLPNIESTKCMIDERLLNLMKPYSTLINTGRGDQINEGDLCKVLRRRPDLTALLDVTQHEHLPWFSQLYFTKNLILSPHIAGSQNNEIKRMIDYVYKSYLQYISGQNPQGEITLDKLETQT